MSKVSGYKLWMWLVGLLMLGNVALLATIWLGPQKNMPPPRRHPVVNLKESLKLTASQSEQFDVLRQNNQIKIDSLKTLGLAARERFFQSLKIQSTSQNELDSLSKVIGDYHKYIELQTYSHLKNVRTILDTRQQVLFDSFVLFYVRSLPEQPRFRGEGPGPGGPPPGGDPNRRPPPPDGFGPPPPPPYGEGPPPDGNRPPPQSQPLPEG